MGNLVSRVRSWIKDPFGQKKEKEENRRIINQIVATRAMIRAATASAQAESDRKFPIAHMVMHERDRKRKD